MSRRKKVLDFYQRSSLTAYCTAFAYRPLSRAISPFLANVYLELPADSRHLYAPHRSPTPLALDSKSKGLLANFQSTGEATFTSLLKSIFLMKLLGGKNNVHALVVNRFFVWIRY